MVLALHACYDIAGNLFRSVTEAKYVANYIAELAVVVLGTIEGTVDGDTVASLVAVTVVLLWSVILLVLVLLLILILVVVTVLVLVVVVVAFAVPVVVRVCAFEVCVLSFGMHVTPVACFCFRLVHIVWIAAMLVLRGIVVAALVLAAIVFTILAVVVLVLVIVAAVVLPRFTVSGFVACLAAVVASHLALATFCLIDNHLVVGQCSGHSCFFYKVVDIKFVFRQHLFCLSLIFVFSSAEVSV